VIVHRYVPFRSLATPSGETADVSEAGVLPEPPHAAAARIMRAVPASSARSLHPLVPKRTVRIASPSLRRSSATVGICEEGLIVADPGVWLWAARRRVARSVMRQSRRDA
jgi:hypothetical protein